MLDENGTKATTKIFQPLTLGSKSRKLDLSEPKNCVVNWDYFLFGSDMTS